MGCCSATIREYGEKLGVPFVRGGRNLDLWQKKLSEWHTAEVTAAETPQEAAYTNESTMTVTAYCPCEKCCGAYSNGYTATGAKATQGVTIATDPDVIPMGTEVEIDGHIYIAQDVGGAISGNRIDLYFDSHEDALQWGVQEKIVRWSE